MHPSFGNYEQNCCKYSHAGLCVDVSFQLLWVSSKKHSCLLHGKNMLSFVRNHQIDFQRGLAVWHSHQPWMRAMLFYILISIWYCQCSRFFYHSNRYIVISYHCFNLHFPEGMWCGVSFHMLICYLYIFYGKISVKVFHPFLNWVGCFLFVEF